MAIPQKKEKYKYTSWPKTLYRKEKSAVTKDNPDGLVAQTFKAAVDEDGKPVKIGVDWFENPNCKAEPPRIEAPDFPALIEAKNAEIKALKAQVAELQEEIRAWEEEANPQAKSSKK